MACRALGLKILAVFIVSGFFTELFAQQERSYRERDVVERDYSRRYSGDRARRTASRTATSPLPRREQGGVEGLVRLPIPSESQEMAPHDSRRRATDESHQRPVDGTWSEDGRYIILNIDGREVRLLNTDARPAKSSREKLRLKGGNVRGQLLHRSAPLVRCTVRIAPLRKGLSSFYVDSSRESFEATTDEKGYYHFDDILPGPYKLFWRPAGKTHWIRRIEYKPDFVIRHGKTTEVKKIRVSLRTIN